MPIAHNFTASPPNQPGYFSPQTSVVNYCEIDYEITPYIAEFINSLSNLAYVYFAFTTLPPKYHPFDFPSWPATNISLVLVGILSFVFHATLKHEAQIADELAMYAITGSLNYVVYTYDPKPNSDSLASGLSFTSTLSRNLLGSALTLSSGYVLYANYITHYKTTLDIHTALFVILLTTFWPRTLYLINHAPSSRVSTGQLTAQAKATHQRRLRTFRFAALSFITGFGIWLCDGIFCHQLRAIRVKIGLPWAWALEGHGIWHLLTALGAGMFVKLVAELRLEAGAPTAVANGPVMNGKQEAKGKGHNKKVSWERKLSKVDEKEIEDSDGSMGSDGSIGSVGSKGSGGSKGSKNANGLVHDW